MSPHRRAVLLGLVAALVLAVALGALAVRRGGASVQAVPQDRLGPVLLVPGYGGSVQSLQVLASALRQAGRDVVVVDLPGDGTGDLRASARRLRAAADSAVAELGAALAPGACPAACRQLVPGSDLLDGLDESSPGPVWTSVWTAQDETVTPPETARLRGSLDVEVQQVCPGARVSHGQLARDPLVVGLVKQALAVPPLVAVPAPSRCAGIRALGAAPAAVTRT